MPGDELSNPVSYVRKKHNLTQEQLAHLLGVAFSTINSWESGKRNPQKKMQEIIFELAKREKIPYSPNLFISDKDEFSGLVRSDAGFVSSILNYNGQRDPLELTHLIGRWYGSLPSFLVRDLCRFLLTDLGVQDPILVNFCGSGTVPLEFALAGHKSFAIDINPAAVLFTNIKTQTRHLPTIDSLNESFICLSNIISDHAPVKTIIQKPNEKNLLLHKNRWIDPHIQQIFLKIIDWINHIKSPSLQVLTSVSFLENAVDFCNIDKRCTNHYVFRKIPVYQDKLFDRLKNDAIKFLNACEALKTHLPYATPEVGIGDATSLNFRYQTFGAVFSHPPYSTAINYYSISRLHLSILELIDLNIDLSLPPKPYTLMSWVQKNDLSSGTIKRFDSLIANWVSESYRVLKSKGIFLVIIGDTRCQGRLLHPHTLVIQEAERRGMFLRELFIWTTSNKSGMHVQRKGHHIDHNYIIILEKP